MDERENRSQRLALGLSLLWFALVFLFVTLGHSRTGEVIAIAGLFLIAYVAFLSYYPLPDKTHRGFGDTGEDHVGCVALGTFILILFTTHFCGLAQDRYSACQRVYDPYWAVQAGDRQTLQILLEGFDINTRGYNLDTPLHAAARRGRLETIDWLIQRGADVNARNYDGETPLAMAAWSKQKEAVRLLRKYEAKVPYAPGDSR